MEGNSSKESTQRSRSNSPSNVHRATPSNDETQSNNPNSDTESNIAPLSTDEAQNIRPSSSGNSVGTPNSEVDHSSPVGSGTDNSSESSRATEITQLSSADGIRATQISHPSSAADIEKAQSSDLKRSSLASSVLDSGKATQSGDAAQSSRSSTTDSSKITPRGTAPQRTHKRPVPSSDKTRPSSTAPQSSRRSSVSSSGRTPSSTTPQSSRRISVSGTSAAPSVSSSTTRSSNKQMPNWNSSTKVGDKGLPSWNSSVKVDRAVPILGSSTRTSNKKVSTGGSGTKTSNKVIPSGGSGTGTSNKAVPSGGSGTGTSDKAVTSGGSGTGTSDKAVTSGGSGTGTRDKAVPSGGTGTRNKAVPRGGSGTGTSNKAVPSGSSGTKPSKRRVPSGSNLTRQNSKTAPSGRDAVTRSDTIPTSESSDPLSPNTALPSDAEKGSSKLPSVISDSALGSCKLPSGGSESESGGRKSPSGGSESESGGSRLPSGGIDSVPIGKAILNESGRRGSGDTVSRSSTLSGVSDIASCSRTLLRGDSDSSSIGIQLPSGTGSPWSGGGTIPMTRQMGGQSFDSIAPSMRLPSWNSSDSNSPLHSSNYDGSRSSSLRDESIGLSSDQPSRDPGSEPSSQQSGADTTSGSSPPDEKTSSSFGSGHHKPVFGPLQVVGIVGVKGSGRNTLAARLVAKFKVGPPRYDRQRRKRLITVVVPTHESDPGDPVERWWRTASLHSLDGIIFLYAMDDPSTLDDITTHWFPRAKKLRPDLPPFYLVGNKLDMRQEVMYQKQWRDLCVPHETGLKVSSDIGAKQFFECTAMSMEQVDNIEELIFDDLLPDFSDNCGVLKSLPTVTVGIFGRKGTGRNTLAARLCNRTDMEQHTVECRENVMEINGKYEFRLRTVVIPEEPPIFGWGSNDSLSKMNFFVVVYAIDEPRSFEHAVFRCLPKLESAVKSPKFCMVGNKRDLRKVIYRERLMNANIVNTLAEVCGATQYFECSAFWNEGTKEIQRAITEIAMSCTGWA